MAFSSSRAREWRVLVAVLLVNDVACILISFAVASWWTSRPAVQDPSPLSSYSSLVLATTVALLLTFAGQGLYDRRRLLRGTSESSGVLRGSAYGLLTLIGLSFLLRLTLSRNWTLLSLVSIVMLVGLTRFLIRRLSLRMRRRGLFMNRTLIVGGGSHTIDLARRLSEPRSGVRIVGMLDAQLPVGTKVAGQKILGKPANLAQVAQRTQADEVVVVSQGLPWETFQDLLHNAVYSPNGLPIHISAGFYDLLTTDVEISERNRIPLLTLRKVSLSRSEAILKRILDYAVAAALLLLSMPVFAWATIRVGSVQPRILFTKQRVEGRFGHEFELLSFSPQVPAASALVRKLPGLVNVLGGELSIVGPRPAPVNGARGVAHKTLTIRPGLTGPWRQTDDPVRQSLLDLYYVRSYTIWLDLQVLFSRAMARVRRPDPSVADSTRSL